MTGSHITTPHLETKIAEGQTRYKLVEKRNAKTLFLFETLSVGDSLDVQAHMEHFRVRR